MIHLPRLMIPQLLSKLLTDENLDTLAFLATPTAVHRALTRNPLVQEIRKQIDRGQVTEDAVRRFANGLIKSLKAGEPFEYDLVIAALAVVLEQRRGSDFADEYLRDLSRLELAEMRMSIRVARECLKSRRALAKTSLGSKVLSSPRDTIVMTYDEYARRFPSRTMRETREQIVCGV